MGKFGTEKNWHYIFLILGLHYILLENYLKGEVIFIKFIYSEKATKFCEIFPLFLTTVHTVKSKGKISQSFVAFSEYTYGL